jgi:hypothetical protein
MSPDLAARRVLMSSYLYYAMDCHVISDHQYEDLVKAVVAGWDELDPIRQWQCESRDAIAASGYGVKLTAATIGGAVAWAIENKVSNPDMAWRWPRKWKRDPKLKLRWVPTSLVP